MSDNLTPEQPNLTPVARKLRQNSTPAEKLLWNRLRAKQLGGLRFRRQQPIGPFVADFFCPIARLVIELDGLSHENKTQKDRERQTFIEAQGICVLRILNEDVHKNMAGVLETIAHLCQDTDDPAPNHLPGERPRKGRGTIPESPDLSGQT